MAVVKRPTSCLARAVMSSSAPVDRDRCLPSRAAMAAPTKAIHRFRPCTARVKPGMDSP